jgi:hypothetical protein
MSMVHGRDLTEFFQQWVYGVGAPEYFYGGQAVTINGRPYLRLRMQQTQDAAWGVGGAFKMPVDVRINTANGSSTVVIENTAREQHFLIPTNGLASSFVIDEFDWILNTNKVPATYVPGPPKIVSIAPAPLSQTLAPASVSSITIGFSDNITAQASHFTVTGPSGSVSAAYTYSSSAFTATLAFAAPLPAGQYTVRVASSLTANGGIALDGEIGATLPSGDGLAGGQAQWTFTVGAACPADWNADDSVDGDDIIAFFGDWDQSNADFNNDGGTDGDDVIDFFAAWDTGC